MGSEEREGFVCSTIQDSRTFSLAANSAAVSISIWEKSCTHIPAQPYAYCGYGNRSLLLLP